MSSSASSFTGSSSDCTTGTPVSSDSPIRENIAAAVRRVRETTPLAQSFTNFVTINRWPTRSWQPAALRP